MCSGRSHEALLKASGLDTLAEVLLAAAAAQRPLARATSAEQVLVILCIIACLRFTLSCHLAWACELMALMALHVLGRHSCRGS